MEDQQEQFSHDPRDTENNENEAIKKRAYYFHADEDFREDWDWGKEKMTASKALTKRVNKFEI